MMDTHTHTHTELVINLIKEVKDLYNANCKKVKLF
jgi:hypothetical protein